MMYDDADFKTRLAELKESHVQSELKSLRWMRIITVSALVANWGCLVASVINMVLTFSDTPWLVTAGRIASITMTSIVIWVLHREWRKLAVKHVTVGLRL